MAVTLKDAAVGLRTVFAPGIVILKLAAVTEVTFLMAFAAEFTVTRNDAAVAERTFFAP